MVLSGGGRQAAARTLASARPMSSQANDLVRDLLPSVVRIDIRKDMASSDDPAQANAQSSTVQASGTGFVIDPSGLIATNYHVVQDAWEIEVTFQDGSRVSARLVRGSQLVDVALLKVDVGHPLPPLRWGDSDKLRIGDQVFAIGNALGIGISVTRGIVSALNRDIQGSPYDDFIQTDAAINHGNSGGPLFNAAGEVVGIDSALISPTGGSSGLGFAIPSNSAQSIIRRLETYGWLRPGWIGMKIQEVTPDFAEALGMRRAEGSLVSEVTPGGPAAAAALRAGDVILRIADSPAADERALLRAIATTQVGKTITLVVLRDGRQINLNVTVQEWPRAQWERFDPPVSVAVNHHGVLPDLGIKLGAPVDHASTGAGTVTSGITVAAVAPDSDAAQRGLAAGDVILRIQDRPVSSAQDVEAAITAARAARRTLVLVLIIPKVQERPGARWLAMRVSDDHSP
jgi:serine protease Do